jgi:hypothetical protein
MRVGFTGTHRTGKTTLIEAISAELPAYDVVDEPYRLLEDEGHDDPDFERQLALSLAIARTGAPDALVDRTPIDFVAYLRASGDDVDIDIDLDAVRDAMDSFDLVVFVPIEEPDRIAVSSSEDRRLRGDVDELLRGLVADLEIPTVEVSGDVPARVHQVIRALALR